MARQAERTERAQTAIDFAAGMGVLLLSLAFVLSFIPSMFAPFFGVHVGDEIIGDRGAASLVENEIGGDTYPPNNLNTSKSFTFFNESCSDSGDIETALSLPDRHYRIEIVAPGGSPVTISQDGESVDAVCGAVPDDRESVSRRMVSIDGQWATVRVRVS